MHGYIANTPAQQKEMLEQIGVSSADDLFADIPEELRLSRKLNLPEPLGEPELAAHFHSLAKKNKSLTNCDCFLGAGAYDHYIPAAIHQILSRQEFYTAYTPYQPEISQGTLQAIFEYQSMICALTGMDAANASLYDGASALAEAGRVACAATGRKELLVASGIHFESMETVETYAHFKGIGVKQVPYGRTGAMDSSSLAQLFSKDTAALLVQTPNFFGITENIGELARLAHQNGSLLIVACNPVSLALLKSPGEWGADIAVGEGQPLGNPLSCGGPYLGFFAAKKELMRKMPGRIVGQTADQKGRRGYVLTLQTREQHIRREKATSNICSNQSLNALAAVIYLSLTGKNGLCEIARQCLYKAHYAYGRLLQTGRFQPVFSGPFFYEFALRYDGSAKDLNAFLLDKNIIGGYDLGERFPSLRNCLLFAVTEKRSKKAIDRLAESVAQQ